MTNAACAFAGSTYTTHLNHKWREQMSVLVGKQAPDFTAKAVMGDNSIKADFNLKSFIKGKIGVLFFYPLDFTFVCPSEIISFDNRIEEFHKLGAEIIGVSVDSEYSHYAWKNTPVEKGGIGNIRFPLVADLTKSIARDYDVLCDNSVAFRGTFMIDKNGVVRHQVVNDMPLGRNVDEAIRMVDALNFHEQHGEVCPAGWRKGEKGMKATKDGVAEYLAEKASSL
jgi:peroxiredoxin (alkyl hydroperoxide reductase subunit C)